MSAEYPSEKCLLTMPDVVMNKVLGKLDFPAIQCLRKTCSTLRTFIDAVKPDPALDRLQIYAKHDNISYMFDEHVVIKCCRNGEGCNVEWRERDNRPHEKLLEFENFVDVTSKDIISVLTNQKSEMELLRVNAFRCPDDILEEQQELLYQFSEQLLSNLESHLASKPKKLQVETFEIQVAEMAQVLHLLPHLDVKNLKITNEKSDNYGAVLNMQELIELEQWKKLDTLEILNCFVNLRIEDLLHLKRCYLHYETINSAMIEELKEAFRTSSHLKSFRIGSTQSDIQHLMDPRYAGPHIQFDQIVGDIETWFFSVSTPERVLVISIIDRQIVFESGWLVFVPEGATIN
ncbi:hypothetical protein GCK72_004412 [Caenorhabditis remanei]|uniref:F-box domain-containing protein n=1 Tax=Caenorhabditis remanei TaxID=31234 RepID=A0A6A5HCA8_CAERE|nr:hypothetical protein GCK72_004412 [Caenorhabditis remanei]KAF1764464.1 hypothetical protein GCK72_004412 [Caenorhabditis remanei]